MRDEDYNIKSFEGLPMRIMPDGQLVFDMFTPTLSVRNDIGLSQYVVPDFEEGRIDLVLTSLYGDNLSSSYSNLDVLLYINGIDNPLFLQNQNINGIYNLLAFIAIVCVVISSDKFCPVFNIKLSPPTHLIKFCFFVPLIAISL